MNRTRIIGLVVIASLSLAMPVFAGDAAALYTAKCAMCHGADGAGQTSMGKAMNLRDLRSPDVQKQTDKELVAWTADGKGKMPGYKAKLSEAEINGLVAYMRDMAKK